MPKYIIQRESIQTGSWFDDKAYDNLGRAHWNLAQLTRAPRLSNARAQALRLIEIIAS